MTLNSNVSETATLFWQAVCQIALFMDLDQFEYLPKLDSMTIKEMYNFPNIALMFFINVLYGN